MRFPAPALTARAIIVSITILAGAVLAGCSSGGGGQAATGPASGGSGAALSSCSSYPGAKSCHFISVTAAGSQAFRGTDTVPYQQTCSNVLAQDASSNGGEVQLSVPVFLTGPVASFTLFLAHYHGPGKYTLASSDADIMFLIGNTNFTPTGSGASISATAGADGSVSVSFGKLSSSADPSKTISGKAQFTCRNA